MSQSKKILLVSYDFPPIGGGGVQRNVKFLKYLSRMNWDTSVLTVKERDYYVYDYTLLNEIPDTKIYKANSFDPVSLSYQIKTLFKRKFKKKASIQIEGNASGINEGAWFVTLYRFIRNWFLLPDGFGLWIPLAFHKGKSIIESNKPDILLATFPHPTNALLTYKLHKKSNIQYVIDFRDGWIDDPYVTFPSSIHKWYHNLQEKKIVNAASAIIVYTEQLKNSLVNRYPRIKDKIFTITNGFDPEDFQNLSPIISSSGKKRIVYSGAVYVDRRETFVCFISALKLLMKSELDQIEVFFVGDKMQWAKDLVNQNSLQETVFFTGYLPHSEALNYLSGADSALMFLKAGDKIALTGKIFEYLGLGLPIIACVEIDGACSSLLKSISHNEGVCSPDKPEEIAKVLKLFLNGNLKPLSNKGGEFFSRKYHAQQLDQVLRNSLKTNL